MKKVMAAGGSCWSSLSSSDRKPMAMCSNFQGLEDKEEGKGCETLWRRRGQCAVVKRFDPHVPVVDGAQEIDN